MTHPVTRAAAAPEGLAGIIVGASPAGILAQEAAGARALVESTLIPTDRGALRQGAWEDLGFVFGDVVDGDPMFQHVELPQGWKREGTSHSMHTAILDERGVQRVGVFYKAAFYDRRANAYLINVGRQIATAVIYGDGPATDIPHLDVLTEAERAGLVEALQAELTRDYAQDKYTERAKAALALLEGD